jgi:hypothetical protein
MLRRSWSFTILRLLADVLTLATFAMSSRRRLAAENLFLRQQLALCQKRHVKPRRPDSATRVVLTCSHACWTGVRS